MVFHKSQINFALSFSENEIHTHTILPNIAAASVWVMSWWRHLCLHDDVSMTTHLVFTDGRL